MGLERIVKGAIGVAGVVSIVASGGGGGFGFIPSCSNNCFNGPITFPDVYSVSINPPQTVQVGTPAVFKATVSTFNSATPKYAWCRTPPEGGACQVISGEVQTTLTVASAALEDDGAQFTITASGNDGSKKSASTQLFVSSMAGVVFTDGDFVDAEWTTSAIITPADLPSTYSVMRMTDGGDPGFYRKVTNDVLESGSVMVFHERPSAVYDPGSQGEIHRIDFSIDCLLITRSAQAANLLLISQGDRRYTASIATSTFATPNCARDPPDLVGRWYTAPRTTLAREDFDLVAGPACGSNEDCPDFSAHAAPLRFGMVTHAYVGGPRPATPVNYHFEQGLDNWKVTVWRK